MVAVHHLQRLAPVSDRSRVRRTGRWADGRPDLRLIQGGASGRSTTASPTSVLSVVAVMAVVLLVVLVRGVQGAPPASDWSGLAATAGVQAADPAAAPLDPYVVGADDTWASIAAQVAPGVDVVEVARQLASVNGGYAIEPGQTLVVELSSPIGD